MRTFVIATVFSLAAIGIALTEGVSAQLPAQKGVAGKGERPTDPPKGKTSAAEPTKVAETKITPKGGGKEKTVAAIVDADYMIGVQGYASGDGIVVLSTVKRKDKNQAGKTRCAAEEILVDFQGNGKTIKVRLERGDKITGVGGYEVKTLDELVVAINSASDPHALEISFIDWKSGNEYSGTINAMKVK